MVLFALVAVAEAADALSMRAQVVGALVQSGQCPQASSLAESILADFNEPLAWEAVAVAALCAPDIVRASEAVPAYQARGGDAARARLLSAGLTDAIKQGGLYDRAVLRAYLMAWPLGGALVSTARVSGVKASPSSAAPSPAAPAVVVAPVAPAVVVAPSPAPVSAAPPAPRVAAPVAPPRPAASPSSKPAPRPPPPEEPEIPVARDAKGRPILDAEEIPDEVPEDLDLDLDLEEDRPPPPPEPRSGATPRAARRPAASERPPPSEKHRKAAPARVALEDRPELPIEVLAWVGGGVGRLAYEQIPLHDSTALFPESFHFNATSPNGEVGVRVGSNGSVSAGGQVDAWLTSYPLAPAALCASAGTSCADTDVSAMIHAVDGLAWVRVRAPESVSNLGIMVIVGGRESNVVALTLAPDTTSVGLLPLGSFHVVSGAGVSLAPNSRVTLEGSWLTELTPAPLSIHQFDVDARVGVSGPVWVGVGYRGLNIISDVPGAHGEAVAVVHYRHHAARVLAGVAF